MTVAVRAFDPDNGDDPAALFAIFFEAAHDGACNHYTEGQRKAWVPSREMPASWAEKLRTQQTFIAQVDGKLAGFMAARVDGNVDLAFVRPCWMGRGVADALYASLYSWAASTGLTGLTTHASHLARPFFARRGWRVDYPETVERDGEVLERFAMSRAVTIESE